MKLLIITAGVLPVPVTKGGAVETLIEYIIEQNEKERKFNITVISIYDREAEAISKKYKYTKFLFINRNKNFMKLLNIISASLYKILKVNMSTKFDYIRKINKLVNLEEYDKIIIENVSEYVYKIANNTKKDFYLHLHNDYLNNETNKYEEICNGSKKIITVSEYIKQRVLTIPNLEKEKVFVLKNCINTSIFNKELYLNKQNDLKKQIGIEPEDVVIMFSGRISKTKGIRELILAFKKIDIPNTKLLILGGSWYSSKNKDRFYEELEEIVQDIRDRVIFTGYIDRDQIPKYHSISDIAIVPSIWEEPAGLTVLEAMASGLALITTDSGGIPEFINSKCAIIVKRDEKMIENLSENMKKLIYDKELRYAMGKEGYKHAQQYSIKKYYSEFCKILSK